MVELAPVSDRVGNKFGPVVEADERGRSATFDAQSVEDGDDVVSVDAAMGVGRKRLAGELVDDVQQLQGPSIDGGIELEVHCPQRVRAQK